MTLLITIFDAVFVTYKWYRSKDDSLQLAPLMFMFWGASLMWMVDAIFEYIELRGEYFMQSPADMLNDAFLGLAVVALALIIWVVRMLITDPKGKVRAALKKQAK